MADVNIGTGPNTGDGDPLRPAFNKINLSIRNLNSNVDGLNAKLTSVPTDTFKARVSDGVGPVQDVPVGTARTMLSVDQVDNTPDIMKPVSVQQADALAAPEQGYVHDFYSSDDDPTVAISLGGKAVFAVDVDGRPIQRYLSDFHSSDEDPVIVIALDNDKALLSFDLDGNLMGYAKEGDAPVPIDEAEITPGMIPYITGSQLRAVGATDTLAANLGDYQATLLAPGNADSVRAVINRPSIGPTTSVSAGGGLMIPDVLKVLHVYITVGQSLGVGANSEGTMILIEPVFPTDALMLQMSGQTDVRLGVETVSGQPAAPLDPSTIIGFTPLVAKAALTGPRGQTLMESCANELARAARKIGIRYRTLSMVHAVGGTAYSGLKKGNQIYTNMLLSLTKLKALAQAEGWRIVVDACLHKHGEAGSTDYFADLIEWQRDIDADVKVITGQQSPVHFIMTQPSTSSSATFASPIAMLRAHNESPYHHLAGVDYPYGEFFAPDNLHFLGPGYHMIGEAMARAIKQVLWTAEGESQIVQITSAVRTGTSVVLNYEVPSPPLVFDTSTVPTIAARGFTFSDSVGPVEVTNAVISGPRQVTLTLASTPTGTNPYVGYALNYQTNPRTAEARPRGNLRDSSADRSTYQNRPLQNWAVHQRFYL